MYPSEIDTIHIQSVPTVTQHQQCYSPITAPTKHHKLTQQPRRLQYLSCVKESSSSSSWMAVAAGEAAMLGCVTRLLPAGAHRETQETD
jgi:hypothetical protein